MRPPVRAVLAFVLLLQLTSAPAPAQTVESAAPARSNQLTPELMLDVKRIGPVMPSPDGARVAFVVGEPAIEGEQSEWVSQVWIANRDGSRAVQLTQSEKSSTAPRWSPDGRWIAITVSDDPPTWAFTSHVHVVPAAGGESRALALTFDEQPGVVGWTADGRRILYNETQGVVTKLWALPVDGAAPALIGAGDFNVFGAQLNETRTLLGFASQDSDTPPEAYVSPGERVPLLVIVHGGPTGVFTRTFIAGPSPYPIAAFAARGYAVLRVNPRGSSGYGREFRYANYRDWGGGDYQDIMSGVDRVIELGMADPDRLGIMGWSYGGYMTSWVITQTQRFKAASVGAGVTNLMSFTGTADIPGFIPDYMGGEFWDAFDTWTARSAMFHVKGVVTPTLVQHGEQDLRVPISQGYELYNALTRQGVETQMVVYPRQPHGIQEPKLVLDAMQRNLDWFAKWIPTGAEPARADATQ